MSSTDDSDEEVDIVTEDDYTNAMDTACSHCDDGGVVLPCEGSCMRCFHIGLDNSDSHDDAYEFSENGCNPLKIPEDLARRLINNPGAFQCPNCLSNVQQCFKCKNEGNSDTSAKFNGDTVARCVEFHCGRYYHPRCIEKKSDDMFTPSFRCPQHICAGFVKNGTCGGHGDLIPCRRCPIAYHENCIPKRIMSTACKTKGKRVWLARGLDDNGNFLKDPVDRSLIYCMDHKIARNKDNPSLDKDLFRGDLLINWKLKICLENLDLQSSKDWLIKNKDLKLKVDFFEESSYDEPEDEPLARTKLRINRKRKGGAVNDPQPKGSFSNVPDNLRESEDADGKRQVQVKKEMISKQIGVGTKQDAKSEQPEIVIFGKEASLPPQKKSKNVPQESMNPSKEPKGGESEVLTSKENPGSSKQTLNIESNKGGSKLSNKTGKISTGQTQAKKDSKDSKAKKTEKPRSDTPATVELDKNPAQKANPKHSKSKLGQTSGAEKKDSLSKKHKSKISNIQKKSSGKVVKNKPKIMGISVAKSKGKSVGAAAQNSANQASQTNTSRANDGINSKEARNVRLDTLYKGFEHAYTSMGLQQSLDPNFATLDRPSLTKIVDVLIDKCGLSENSHVIDIGSGLCRVLWHMSVAAGVHVAEGIDCKEEWYSNAFDFGDAISEVLEKHEATSTYPHIQPKAMEGNVMDIKHHNTATHIFAFWDGFDEDAKHQVAKIFSGSEHVKYLAIVQTNIMSNTVKSLEGMGFARPKIVEVFKDLKVDGTGNARIGYIVEKLSPAKSKGT